MNLLTPVAYYRSDAESALVRFLIERAEALVAAAALLGEEPAVRRTARLLEDIIDAPQLSRRLRRELVELHRLPALDRGGSGEPGGACFARIDPCSPVGEEICRVTDDLRAHLLMLVETDGEAVWEEIASAA